MIREDNILKDVFVSSTINFLALEGIDGCGKTTIISKLKKEYPEIFYTREPGGTAFASDIRTAIIESDNKDAYGMTLGMGISRLHNMLENYDIFTNKEKHIVSDRWVMSNLVYQQAYDDSILKNGKTFTKSSLELAVELQHLMNDYLDHTLNPIYIYLHICPETSLARQADKTDKDKMDKVTLKERTLIAEVYESLIAKGVFGKVKSIEEMNTCMDTLGVGVIYIDANKDFDTVYANVVKAIKLCFNIK